MAGEDAKWEETTEWEEREKNIVSDGEGEVVVTGRLNTGNCWLMVHSFYSIY